MTNKTPAPTGRTVYASIGTQTTNIRAQSPQCDTCYDGEFDNEYRKLNGCSMEHLLVMLASMTSEHLIALRSHVSYADGSVFAGRLMVAMDAVYYRQTPALRPEGIAIVASEADAFHLESDQKSVALRYIQMPLHPRIKTPTQTNNSSPGTPFPDTQLREFGTSEQTIFKRAVYNAHVASAQHRGRQFHQDLSSSELAVVEGGHRMRRDAASACVQLLDQARKDLESSKESQSSLAIGAHSIGVGSAYRSATTEFGIWDSLFESYYNDTSNARAGSPDGEHGPRAVGIMVNHYTMRKAAPGFGNHTNGIAVDFITAQGNARLGASVSQNGRWRQSWFHGWLVDHASEFYFTPLSSEAWHWEYHQ